MRKKGMRLSASLSALRGVRVIAGLFLYLNATSATTAQDHLIVLVAGNGALGTTTSVQSVTRIAEIHSNDITNLRFSNDGKKIFAERDDGTSIIWEPAKSAGFKVVRCSMVIGDGSRCVNSWLGSDSGPKILDTLTGKALYILSNDVTDVTDDVVVSPFGSYIALVAVRGITLIDAKSGARISNFPSRLGFDKVLFSPDEAILLASNSEEVIVYDLKARQQSKLDISGVRSLVVSKKGALFGITSDFDDPQVVTTTGERVSGDLSENLSRKYDEIAGFLDADSKVVMKSSLGEVGVWNWKTNEVVDVSTKAERLAVAETGFLAVTKEGLMELWDSNTKKVHTFGGAMSFGILTPDGTHILTVSREGSLTLWEISGPR